ncbi:MAG: hypothetical protein HC836_34515 [Richelia sp. RM2_1_2]|nr:hypothetical protein [Richelia sp. RM2_1_2]
MPTPRIPPPGRPQNPPTPKSSCAIGTCGSEISKKQDAANNQLGKLNLLLQSFDLAAVTNLNNKMGEVLRRLGPQLPGDGISGFLTNFFTKFNQVAKWLQLDRALNILTFAATVHNAAQLSNDIGQTLTSALSNVLALIGIKDADGQPINLSQIIGNTVQNVIKGIIGAENFTTFSLNWQKANRIYQSTNNVLNAFQGLSSAILTGLEMTAGKVAKIGNALRSAGEVLENAYGWMNPQPKFNRVIQTLETLQNGASTIQQVTQAPLDIINATTELTNATTELTNAIMEDTKPENKGKESPQPIKLRADKANGKKVSAGLDLFDFDFDIDLDPEV